MNDLLQNSYFFGIGISIFAYFLGTKLRNRFNYSIVNPLLIAIVLIITFLIVFRIDYDTYNYGAQYITFFLTPATVCLAIPLYKQIKLLQKHFVAVIISVLCGCIAHLVSLVLMVSVLSIDHTIFLSLLSKSVTSAIAMGIAEEVGGISSITIIGVVIAGIMGAALGPILLKLFRITEPIAQGLAVGTAAHALGTSRMVEVGEIQGAMSSLAIVVTGIMTVVIVPIVVPYL